MQNSSVKLIWKKNFLSGTHNIYENNQPVGELNNNCFSNSSEGVFKQKRYKFKSKGFFNQRTEIIDLSDGNIIGDITYNSWFNEAKIRLHKDILNFKTDNIWCTKWSVYNYDNTKIEYKNTFAGGEIISNVKSELPILCGLYVINYYWQIMLIILILVIVIL